MLLTITTTHRPATDLGHLLHTSPERLQSFPLPFGQAHVFYPEASDERCTAAFLLDVDPVGLIRRGVKFPRLDQYVNDRPYVASSFLSVAISRVFTTALAGKSKARPELAEAALPLQARIIYGPEYTEPANLERLRPGGWAESSHSQRASSRSGSKRSNDSSARSPSAGFTSACSVSWRSRASRSIRGCDHVSALSGIGRNAPNYRSSDPLRLHLRC
jgi:hypothetical protein